MKKIVYVRCHNCGEQGCVIVETDSVIDLSTALDESDVLIEVENLGPTKEEE